jgi:pimeloyl-ACP methyl ester carboxylesterase
MELMQVVIDGILTNYQEFGSGNKTLLILPGWRRSINEWLSVARFLEGKYRIILLDLPGFGGLTEMPKTVYGVFEFADFVKKFLLKLKIENCILLGHSFGGRVGIILASEKDLVEELILVDSSGIEKKSLYVKLMHILKIASSPVFIFFPHSVKMKIGNIFGSADYKTSGEMRKILVKVSNQDLTAFLPKIKVPTFILWGDKDKMLPVAESKEFKKRIEGSKVRIVWGAGHDPHLQKPEQLISILKDIL